MCLAVSAPVAVLSGLEEVASSLEVSLSDALNLTTQQPTLLLAKVGAARREGSAEVLLGLNAKTLRIVSTGASVTPIVKAALVTPC